jgi:hypothetical protein
MHWDKIKALTTNSLNFLAYVLVFFTIHVNLHAFPFLIKSYV